MNNTTNNSNNTERQTYQNRPTQSASSPRPVQRPAQSASTRPSRPAGATPATQSAQRSTAGTQTTVRRPVNASAQQSQQTRPAQTTQQPRPVQPRPSTGTNTRLTVEERRRIEAARLAAMSSVKRMSDEEEYRLRKMEQDFLEAEQPKTTRSTQQRTVPQPREDDRVATAPAYRRKKRVKINWGVIILTLILAAVIGVSAWHIVKNPWIPSTSEGETTDIGNNGTIGGEYETDENGAVIGGPGESDSDEGETEPPEEDAPLVMYETRIHLNKYIDVGNQILINNNHAYARVGEVELTYVRANRTSDIQVSATLDSLTKDAFEALDKMTADLRAAGAGDWLLLTSGYRNVEEQQSIWDKNLAQNGEDYTRRYVAIPGYSEHHTGLACDLSFFTYSYATIPVADHEYGSWLWENCSNYGFILRYTKDMEATTGIAYEPWHFRYIGFPHAKAVEHFDLCYEDYIELLKKYTFETRILYVKADGTVSSAAPEEMPTSDGYLIYYVPMAEGESTQIKIPTGFEYKDVEISGNNVDGFIVTVHLYPGES